MPRHTPERVLVKIGIAMMGDQTGELDNMPAVYEQYFARLHRRKQLEALWAWMQMGMWPIVLMYWAMPVLWLVASVAVPAVVDAQMQALLCDWRVVMVYSVVRTCTNMLWQPIADVDKKYSTALSCVM